ncbi:hypothetical protein C8F01DRAFT_2199 [Mycena amicta]|nr:hypothetical protein C8F01DRAFT_2199 [Mycena amicta]
MTMYFGCWSPSLVWPCTSGAGLACFGCSSSRTTGSCCFSCAIPFISPLSAPCGSLAASLTLARVCDSESFTLVGSLRVSFRSSVSFAYGFGHPPGVS